MRSKDQKFGLSLITVSRGLKVPQSLVQIIICRYEQQKEVQPLHILGSRQNLCQSNELLLVSEPISQQKQNTLKTSWGRLVLSEWNESCTYTGLLQRKKPLFQNQLYKSRSKFFLNAPRLEYLETYPSKMKIATPADKTVEAHIPNVS